LWVWQSLLTRRSHTISFEQLLPVLFASPKSEKRPELPLKFQGGFALSAKQIGTILTIQGCLQMVAQLIVFPIVSKKLGNLWTYRIVIFGYPILYLFIPYLPLLPTFFRMPSVYLVIVAKVTAQAFSYPSLAIMLTNLAPSKRVLGTLNGAAASSATLCRTLGPLVSGGIQSWGSTAGYSGIAWWACAAIATVGVIEGLMITEENGRIEYQHIKPMDEEASPGKLDSAGDVSDSEVTACDDSRRSSTDDGTLCDSPGPRLSVDAAFFIADP
jgi:hypothetical protein